METRQKTRFRIIHNEQTPAVPNWTIEELLEKKDILEDFLDHASKSYKTGIGLAANQVGIVEDGGFTIKRRFMMPVFAKKNLDTGEWFLVLNPIVTDTSGALIEQVEYCLTWPDKKIIANRYKKITVEWYDLSGEKQITEAEDYEAQVWQHEINHLLGIEEVVLEKKGGLEVGKKVGRNDPCPCGSRKKYKQCCL